MFLVANHLHQGAAVLRGYNTKYVTETIHIEHVSFYLFAVVAQAYKVEVEVLGASRGCTVVLRCVVPSFVKDLIRIVSWVQEPSFYIYPSLQGGKNHLCFHTDNLSSGRCVRCMAAFVPKEGI